MKKIKNIHIAIIIAGIIFNCISIFHPNLWFDEAYSVGIANKSFADIWTIGGNDVHPILYYWILHIIYLIAKALGAGINETIVAYRVFSAISISLLGILGFTHIRKDFGEKVGAFFSFFSYFLPVICIYAAEVRMYSLAILLVTILAIYAYRLFKNENSIKNWLIFGITSLASIYVHYYGLMAAGIINCVLLYWFIKEKKTKSIIKLLVSGAIQLAAYIPWIMYFMKQLKNVSGGFWIGFEFPKTLFQLIGTQFSGNLEEVIGFIFAAEMYVYIVYKIIQNKKSQKNNNNSNKSIEDGREENKQDKFAIISIGIYISVIIAAILITAVMRTSILYYRYLFVITGLFIFFISHFVAKEKNKFFVGAICATTVILGICSNVAQIKEAYNKNNMTPIAYLQENVQKGDIILFDESNFGTGSVVSLYFTDNKQLYYNPSDWGVEAAYEAFGKQLKIYTNTDFLKECDGRIWIIDSDNSDYYNKFFNNENYRKVSQKMIKIGYENYVYNMILVEKVEMEEREESHVISNIGLKFVPKDDLLILTDRERNQLKELIDYEFVAMDANQTRILYCFIDNGEKIEKDLSAKEYLEQAFNGEARGEISTVAIADNKFEKTTLLIDKSSDNYNIDCYVAKVDGKYLCLNYWYPKTEQSNLAEMIESVEIKEQN